LLDMGRRGGVVLTMLTDCGSEHRVYQSDGPVAGRANCLVMVPTPG
jgi:hypothetical protein